MSLFTLFILLNIVNVMLQTAKSIATVKGTPIVAAASNALAYFVYTYVLIYTSIDGLSMITKAIVVAASNLVGVLIVKVIERKMQKDKLWKIEFTVNGKHTETLRLILEHENLSFNYQENGKHTLFNVYCPTQCESAKVMRLIKEYNAKYFVSENRSIL